MKGSWNNTNVPDLILMGLTDSEVYQRLLFMLFLLIYLITVLGNSGMVLIIHLDLQLHTPMYFFLGYPSFLDFSYSTVIRPKTLENLLTSNNYISFMSCFPQMYFCLPVWYCFLLYSMAYDCYVTIFNPLHYPVVMSMRLYCNLNTGSYMIGFTESLVNVLCMNNLHFCKSNVVHHFFCDLTPLLALSCTGASNVEIMKFTLGGSTVVMSLFTIPVSFVFILSTILKSNSTSGKQQAFSICASHLLGVIIFYGTIIFTFLKGNKSYSLGRDQLDSVFYTVVIPMLNPLIYSLRNKDVKNAFIRVMQKRKDSRQLK